MSNRLMSIMVLNWNRRDYSQKTIERILEKTTMRHELILIDNFSTEESGVRQYLDTVKGNGHTVGVKRVYNDRNFGVGGGRNTGLMVATGDYLVNIDDDVLVPNNWDVLMADACDKVPRLGLTGVNVEPHKFTVRAMNGVRLRFKAGNLGGALLCMPRRVFKRIGYYMARNLYGMEDVEMKCRLDLVGLLSAYIEPMGIHFDTDRHKAYRAEKTKAHVGKSKQLVSMNEFRKEFGEQIKKTGSYYVPFSIAGFNPVDDSEFTNELIKKG